MQIPTYVMFILVISAFSVSGMVSATTNTDDIISDFSGEQIRINTLTTTPLLELRDNDGDGVVGPIIDFVNDDTSDFDARIILITDDLLRFSGASLEIPDGFFRSGFSGEEVVFNGNPINARIELRDRDGDGQTPFIDFSNDPTSDFDGRIILEGDDVLAIHGADLKIKSGNILSDGDICIGNCP